MDINMNEKGLMLKDVEDDHDCLEQNNLQACVLILAQ